MEKFENQNLRIFEELTKVIERLPLEQQRRILYVLDYILNYFQGERRVPKLSEIGFYNEVNELKTLGVIVETTKYLRNMTYPKLEFKEGLEDPIRNLLQQKYYKTFKESDVVDKIREIVVKSLSAATKLWHKVQEFKRIESKVVEYTISGYGEYQADVIELCKELSKCEFGYYIGYWSTSGTTYSDEFIFRLDPINVQTIFLRVVEEEVNRVFTSFDPAMRWSAYLKFLFPDLDERFALNNATTRFLPSEIKQALAKLPDLRIEKFKDVVETILAKERERLLDALRSLFNRDPLAVQTISALLLLAEERERYFNVSKWSLDKIKESFPQSYEKLSDYVKILRDLGVVLVSNYGDFIIPKMVQEVFNEAIKGGALELKIFESELDAEAFIEETMAKATSNIKIWDPYVSTRTLRAIEKSIKPENVLVEVLSSQPIVVDDIHALVKKGIKIKAKIIYQKKGEKYLSPFHDRYLIVDKRYVWHFGPSLHAAGQKAWESAFLFSESFAKVILDAFMYNFCKNPEEWNQDGYQVVEIDLK